MIQNVNAYCCQTNTKFLQSVWSMFCIDKHDYIKTFPFNVTITKVVFMGSEGVGICIQKQLFKRGLEKSYIEWVFLIKKHKRVYNINDYFDVWKNRPLTHVLHIAISEITLNRKFLYVVRSNIDKNPHNSLIYWSIFRYKNI